MKSKFKKAAVLVTLGPTRAHLDRFRYISNHSTGELGYLVCKRLLRSGYRVLAVAGPCQPTLEKLSGVKVVRVETVDEMQEAVMELTRKHHPKFAVLAAAVLDFAPRKMQQGKVSSKNKWKLELIPTPKIIDTLSDKFPGIHKIGFKLEWKAMDEKRAVAFALRNIIEKKLDALCLNFLSEITTRQHPAFLVTRSGTVVRASTKLDIAKWILTQIEGLDQEVSTSSSEV